jgi:hypothetical protein
LEHLVYKIETKTMIVGGGRRPSPAGMIRIQNSGVQHWHLGPYLFAFCVSNSIPNFTKFSASESRVNCRDFFRAANECSCSKPGTVR